MIAVFMSSFKRHKAAHLSLMGALLLFAICFQYKAPLWALLLALTIFVAAGTVTIFGEYWRGESRLRSLLLKLSVAVSAVLLSFTSIESYLFFAEKSDANAHSLRRKRWMDLYWKPINSYGYRDVEHTPEELSGRKVVFAVGDSFTAGFGIKNPKDRFSDILGSLLSRNWTVINIAKLGWESRREYRALLSHPAKPEVIILQYYVNDIRPVAKNAGITIDFASLEPKGALMQWLVNRSYAANFFYYRWAKIAASKPSSKKPSFLEYLDMCYKDPKAWRLHQENLIKFIDFSREQQIRLIAVIFPHLGNVERTAWMCDKVARFFKDHDVQVVDMAPLIKERDPKDLIVNMDDPHPSVQLHREVAELIFPLLTSPASSANPQDGTGSPPTAPEEHVPLKKRDN